MKTYTITLPKNNNNISTSYLNSNYNAESALKDMLATNAANKYPWLRSNYDNNTNYTIVASSAKPVNILYNYGLNDFYKAMTTLKSKSCYYNPFKSDDYDYEIDGTPVTIFSNFIKVGNTIIPMNNNEYYFNTLTPEVKKTIVNITIKLNNFKY